MLSGTGVRDAGNGGYLELNEIGISVTLQVRIKAWLAHYEDAHFHQFNDERRVAALDEEGVEIARMIKTELPSAKVAYFSHAHMKAL